MNKLQQRILVLLIFMISSPSLHAQFTFVGGNNALEIGGWITSSYTKRFYPLTNTNHKKDAFSIDNARISFTGFKKNQMEYQLELNIASIDAAVKDITATPLVNANITFKQIKYFNVKVGYQKLPYSFNSMTSEAHSPFSHRSEISRGDIFARRDVGVLFFRDFLNQTLNIYAGTFTGMGEQSILGNDASGKLEYMARIDYSYPSKYRWRFIDMVHTPVPQLMVGLNGRYSNKQSFSGTDLIKTIDGEKYVYGADFNFMFQGFSMQLESEQIRLQPRDLTLLTPFGLNHYLTGGWSAQMNYYAKQIKSVVAVRYDDYNPSNIILNDNRPSLGIAYNYMFNGYKSMMKLNYNYRLPSAKGLPKWKDDQVSISYQWLF